MNPEVLQQDVMGVGVGLDAIRVIVVDGVAAAAAAGVDGLTVLDALGVAGYLEALDVNVLSAFEVHGCAEAKATEDLGLVGAGAAGVVLPEDAGVPGWRSFGDGGSTAREGSIAAEAPDVLRVRALVEADAPWAVAKYDGVATGDHPLFIAVALIIPEIAVVLEGAVLVGSFAGIGFIRETIALPLLSV